MSEEIETEPVINNPHEIHALLQGAGAIDQYIVAVSRQAGVCTSCLVYTYAAIALSRIACVAVTPPHIAHGIELERMTRLRDILHGGTQLRYEDHLFHVDEEWLADLMRGIPAMEEAARAAHARHNDGDGNEPA